MKCSDGHMEQLYIPCQLVMLPIKFSFFMIRFWEAECLHFITLLLGSSSTYYSLNYIVCTDVYTVTDDSYFNC